MKYNQYHVSYKSKIKTSGASVEGFLGFTHSFKNRVDVQGLYDHATELARKQTPEIIGNVVLSSITIIDQWED